MYTEPVIVHSADEKSRSYVKLFYNGKRLRFYTGKALGITCFPNESKNPVDRIRLLQQLQFEIKKRLEKGWNPTLSEKTNDPFKGFTLYRCIADVMNEIQTEDISNRYREDLSRISKELQAFLTGENMTKTPQSNLDPKLLQRFLSQYSSSGTYYMTKRRTLAGLFARMVNNGMLTENPVHKTSRKKEVHILNAAFPPAQLKGLLTHLEEHHPQLYLCALIMYGCFLRPHREIRLLKRNHFNETCTTVTLSGTENKSKRIRVVALPKYVTQALMTYGVHEMDPDQFVISRSIHPVNEDYFTTAWTRQKKDFPKNHQLKEGQTLYSFRHSGAVAVYEKTKDPFKVQQSLGHSSLTVTLRYLRSLGLSLTVEEFPDL